MLAHGKPGPVTHHTRADKSNKDELAPLAMWPKLCVKQQKQGTGDVSGVAKWLNLGKTNPLCSENEATLRTKCDEERAKFPLPGALDACRNRVVVEDSDEEVDDCPASCNVEMDSEPLDTSTEDGMVVLPDDRDGSGHCDKRGAQCVPTTAALGPVQKPPSFPRLAKNCQLQPWAPAEKKSLGSTGVKTVAKRKRKKSGTPAPEHQTLQNRGGAENNESGHSTPFTLPSLKRIKPSTKPGLPDPCGEDEKSKKQRTKSSSLGRRESLAGVAERSLQQQEVYQRGPCDAHWSQSCYFKDNQMSECFPGQSAHEACQAIMSTIQKVGMYAAKKERNKKPCGNEDDACEPAVPSISLDHILSCTPYRDMLRDLFGGGTLHPDGGTERNGSKALRPPSVPVVTRLVLYQ